MFIFLKCKTSSRPYSVNAFLHFKLITIAYVLYNICCSFPKLVFLVSRNSTNWTIQKWHLKLNIKVSFSILCKFKDKFNSSAIFALKCKSRFADCISSIIFYFFFSAGFLNYFVSSFFLSVRVWVTVVVSWSSIFLCCVSVCCHQRIVVGISSMYTTVSFVVRSREKGWKKRGSYLRAQLRGQNEYHNPFETEKTQALIMEIWPNTCIYTYILYSAVIK